MCWGLTGTLLIGSGGGVENSVGVGGGGGGGVTNSGGGELNVLCGVLNL